LGGMAFSRASRTSRAAGSQLILQIVDEIV
jgi:hypothetical protein